jgi:hypothetical protein
LKTSRPARDRLRQGRAVGVGEQEWTRSWQRVADEVGLGGAFALDGDLG